MSSQQENNQQNVNLQRLIFEQCSDGEPFNPGNTLDNAHVYVPAKQQNKTPDTPRLVAKKTPLPKTPERKH